MQGLHYGLDDREILRSFSVLLKAQTVSRALLSSY